MPLAEVLAKHGLELFDHHSQGNPLDLSAQFEKFARSFLRQHLNTDLHLPKLVTPRSHSSLCNCIVDLTSIRIAH
ncbi:hypothetical protein D3C86_1883720 [compost metagenome]